MILRRLSQRLTPLPRLVLCRNAHFDKVRNIGIVAHIDAGKTTTTEYMLFLCGKIDSVGRVDNGDTVMDFLPQERERGITISSAAISCSWKNHQINIIDTPGHVDFSVEVELSTRVLDGCVLVVDAVAGVQCQTKSVWRRLYQRSLPAVAFVNKMDRVGASLPRTMESLRSHLSVNPLALQMPLFDDDDQFRGFVDLITMQVFRWPIAATAIRRVEDLEPIVKSINDESESVQQEAAAERKRFIESLAEVDDSLLERFLSLDDPSSQLSVAELLAALRRAVSQRLALPVICGASLRGLGVHALLDAVCALLPDPSRHRLWGPVGWDQSPTNASIEKLGESEQRVVRQLRRAKAAALVYKVVANSAQRGPVCYVRVLRGSMEPQSVVLNARLGEKERVVQLFRPEAQRLLNVKGGGRRDYDDEVDDDDEDDDDEDEDERDSPPPAPILEETDSSAGNVVCVTGLQQTRPGDLLLVPHKGKLAAAKASKTLSADEMLALQQEPSVLGQIPPPVFTWSVSPATSAQYEELEAALRALAVEDPSLVVHKDPETGELCLGGLGELHLEVSLEKLRRGTKGRLGVVAGTPEVSCRETLLLRELPPEQQRARSSYTYSRTLQDTGKRLFAGITFEIRPLEKQDEASTWALAEAAALQCAHPEREALLETLQRSLSRGPSGHPVAGLSVQIAEVVRDGAQTTVGALRAAAALGLAEALQQHPQRTLLHPVARVEIYMVPPDCVGSVVADLAGSRRALHVEVRQEEQEGGGASAGVTVEAEVALQHLLGYSTSLRSMTRGEAAFSTEFLGHVPLE